jgi:hypothetical protein
MTEFFSAVTLAYLVVCALWLGLDGAAGGLWTKSAVEPSQRRWLDFAVALLVVVAVLGLGQLWRAGHLLPRTLGPPLLIYNLNMLMIWAPLGVALLVRRAPLATVLLSLQRGWLKVLLGIALGALGVAVYFIARGEPARVGPTLVQCLGTRELAHFVPVFLEGVGVAFLYVRLRWVAGPIVALALPCLLFAAAHVPRQLDAGSSAGEIAAFFVFDTLLPFAISATVVRSRDVIWIGMAHYMLDVAIGAFD